MADGDPVITGKTTTNLVPNGINEVVTQLFPYDSDAWGSVGSRVDGPWANFVCTANNVLMAAQNTQQADTLGMVDGLFIQHQDYDTTAYTYDPTHATYRQITNGIRVYASGAKISGTWNEQAKDIHGMWASARGCTKSGHTVRGVSGVLGECFQYGAGVATNELHAVNPSDATYQASAMAGVIGGIQADKGDFDAGGGSRAYRALEASVMGTGKIKMGLRMVSVDETATAHFGIDMSELRVVGAGINMGGPSSTNQGTIIVYDNVNGDYSSYDRTGNAFVWTIANMTGMYLNSGGLYIVGTCDADDYLTHSKVYIGSNALKHLDTLRPKGGTSTDEWGELDHAVLTKSVKVPRPDGGDSYSLTKLLAIAVRAIKELEARIVALEGSNV